MILSLFIRTMLLAFSLSLILFAFGIADLSLLIRLLAFSLGFSALISIFYPQLRGVKRGDKVLVIFGTLPSFLGNVGTAQTDGKINQEIRVKMDDGSEVVGIIESYEGLFTPAKIRWKQSEKVID